MAWFWYVIAFVCGAITGVVITAVIAAENAMSKNGKKWWEDNE